MAEGGAREAMGEQWRKTREHWKSIKEQRGTEKEHTESKRTRWGVSTRCGSADSGCVRLLDFLATEIMAKRQQTNYMRSSGLFGS